MILELVCSCLICFCSADELLLTEMLFAGLFNDLEPAAVVALLSCFVAEGAKASGDGPKISDRLQGILRQCQEFARKIAVVSKECDVPIDENSYVQALKPDLMEICFSWCNGASFSDICKKTAIYEGILVSMSTFTSSTMITAPGRRKNLDSKNFFKIISKFF